MVGEHFNDCFSPVKRCGNKYFEDLWKILKHRICEKPTTGYMENHHIIPKSWFRLHGLRQDDSYANMVFLNLKEHIQVHILMYWYFLSVKDHEMVSRMLMCIDLMTREKLLRRDGLMNLDKDTLDEYERIREEYYKERRKDSFTIDDLRKMFEIYSSKDDSVEGFELVKKQFAWSTKMRNLQDWFKKIWPDEYAAVVERQAQYHFKKMRMLRKTSLKNMFKISRHRIRKFIKRRHQKMISNLRKEYRRNKKIAELKPLYEKYLEDGTFEMKKILNVDSLHDFLLMCRSYGLYEPDGKSAARAIVQYRKDIQDKGIRKAMAEYASIHTETCPKEYLDALEILLGNKP